MFNSQNRCKVVVPNELGRELEHFNWATGLSFPVLSPTIIQILHSQFGNLFTLKPKRIKLARYVRILTDSFSLTKILMELMQCWRFLIPLGQFFSIFDLFSVISLQWKLYWYFLSVTSHCACRFEISGDGLDHFRPQTPSFLVHVILKQGAMSFCVQLESRQPKVYVKTNQYWSFCCPKQGKKQYKLCPGEVSAY